MARVCRKGSSINLFFIANFLMVPGIFMDIMDEEDGFSHILVMYKKMLFALDKINL